MNQRESRHGLYGVFCAALTFLNEALEPDAPHTIDNCARLLAEGCDGINLLGTTGEATNLGIEARLRLMEAVAATDLPLDRFMVGTGAAALGDAVALTSRAVALGFTAQLVIPPFYYKNVSDEGVFRYYAELIARVNDSRLRLILYNFPQMSAVTIAPALVERLADAYPSIVAGIKDSSGSFDYASELVARCANLAVFPGSEGRLDAARTHGFAGCISATVNVTAGAAARVWSGFASSEDAKDLRSAREALERYPMIPALRYIMSTRGAEPGWLRTVPPLAPLSLALRERLDADLQSEVLRSVGRCL